MAVLRLLSWVLVAFHCMGQERLVVIGDTPSGRTPLPVAAPAEVITLLVRGWDPNPNNRKSIVAPIENPPFELNGISAFVHYAEGDPVPLPILRIDPSGTGLGLLYTSDAHAITVLLPSTLPYRQSSGRITARFQVSVSRDGVPGLKTEYEVTPVKFRILSDCLWASFVPPGSCTSQVFHQDGESRAGIRSPASLGEEVSIRAIGLGRMDVFSVVARILLRDDTGSLVNEEEESFVEVPVTHERQLYSGYYRINVKMPVQLPANVFSCSAERPGWNARVEVATKFPGGISDNLQYVDLCVQP